VIDMRLRLLLLLLLLLVVLSVRGKLANAKEIKLV